MYSPARVALAAGLIQWLTACAVAVNQPAAQPFDDRLFSETENATLGAYMRIVDVGSALCIVAATGDGQHFVYDAGGADEACLKAVREIVGNNRIDLLVISHSDVAHMQDVPTLLLEFDVGEIWWTAYPIPRPSFRKTRRAIGREAAAGARVRTLREDDLSPGSVFELGKGRMTLVAGGGLWAGNDELGEDLLAKAQSLIVRLDYGESSVLMTGDTIGRLTAWPDDRCGFAEARLAKPDNSVSPAADVLIAPNHGANTASSKCLIDAVQPTWVILPAGHQYGQPRAAVAQRYLDAGIATEHLLRTDRGDDEGEEEWSHLRSRDCRDQPGDDDIEVLIPVEGKPTVRYLRPRDVCVVLR